jgi:hypothetical protein
MVEPGAPRLPFAVRAADVATVALAVLTLFVLSFGGFILHLGPIPLRVHSPLRLVFLAVACAAIRHVAFPADPLHRRVVRGLRAGGDESAASIARAALATRAAALLVGYFAVVTIGVAEISQGFQVSPHPLPNLPARFDAGWYSSIALEGYSFDGNFNKQQNVAFFPAYPALERVAGYPLGAFAPGGVPRETRLARLLWGGIVVSFLSFAWAAVYLWRLARETIGEARAPAAVALLAAYPFAVFFSAAYTESLFLLGALAAVYHFRRQELAPAAAWGFLVGLTRPNGCFLSIVLACFIAERWWAERKLSTFPDFQISKSLASASAPGLGMLAFSAYVHRLTGDFFGWARLHEAWGRSFEGLAPVSRAYGWLTEEGLTRVVQNVPFDTLNSLALIFVLLMLWSIVRRLGFAFAVFVLVNVVPPMLAGGVLSMGRLTATLFPVFLALAAVLPPRAVTPLVTAFAIGQGLAAVLFFTWRPLF